MGTGSDIPIIGVHAVAVTTARAEARMPMIDNSFTTASTVEKRRKLYGTLKTLIFFILPTSGAECFLIMASILFGTILPLPPTHSLWMMALLFSAVPVIRVWGLLHPDVYEKPLRNFKPSSCAPRRRKVVTNRSCPWSARLFQFPNRLRLLQTLRSAVISLPHTLAPE